MRRPIGHTSGDMEALLTSEECVLLAGVTGMASQWLGSQEDYALCDTCIDSVSRTLHLRLTEAKRDQERYTAFLEAKCDVQESEEQLDIDIARVRITSYNHALTERSYAKAKQKIDA